MEVEIRAPIFIVGAPRSGTSVLYEKLAQHPDLAWISNVTKKTAGSWLATRALALFRSDHRPTEAKRVWGRLPKTSSPLPVDVPPRARRFVRRVVAHNLRLFQKSRFLSKDPGNSFRMPLLDAIFPDARFLHIVRDGRAVAFSTLKNRERRGGEFWGIHVPDRPDLEQLPMLEACGLQWKLTLEAVECCGERLPAERYMEVRYEDFCERPESTLRTIGDRFGLSWEASRLADVVADVESQDFKWKQGLGAEKLALLDGLIGETLTRLGYER